MERVTYLKIKQSTISLIVRIAGLTVFLLLFWLVKSWFFGAIGDLTGIVFFNTIAQVSFLFWVSIIVYGIMVLGMLVKWHSITYEVYTDRISIKSGIVSRKAFVVSLADFSQFEVNQGIAGRIFGYGTIEFMYRTIGPTGGFGETFYNIPNPEKTVAELRSLMKLADENGQSDTIPRTEDKYKDDAEILTAAAIETDDRPNAVSDELNETQGAEADQSNDANKDADISGEIQF